MRLGRGRLRAGVVCRGVLFAVGRQERGQRGQRCFGSLLSGVMAAAGNGQGLHVAGSEPAVQVEYAPFGQGTGLCAAVATPAYQNEGLSLQPCSTPGTTVFIIDKNDSPGTWPAWFPIVNASTADFTHPYTMTIDGNPADKPFPQITLQRMHDNPTDVPDNQLWQAPPGPAN